MNENLELDFSHRPPKVSGDEVEAVCAFPPERLLSAPDATIMQTTHAAVLLCSLATVKSQPPLGPGYLRSNIQLIDQTSAAFRRASITEEDTVLHIAIYLESLLRPKNASPTHAAQNRATAGAASASETQSGGMAASGAGSWRGSNGGTQGSLFGSGPAGGMSSNHANGGQNGGAASLQGAAMAGNTPNLNNGFAQFTNFTLLSNNTDMFYSGNNHANATAGTNGARWFNNNNHAGPQPTSSSAPAQDNSNSLFFNSGNPGSFDREGLDAIASAAAAAAAAQNGEEPSGAPMDMSGVNWSSAMGSNPVSAPWNSLMFGNGTPTTGIADGYAQAGNSSVFGQQQQQHQQQQNREQADETLRMLLRFLDG